MVILERILPSNQTLFKIGLEPLTKKLKMSWYVSFCFLGFPASFAAPVFPSTCTFIRSFLSIGRLFCSQACHRLRIPQLLQLLLLHHHPTGLLLLLLILVLGLLLLLLLPLLLLLLLAAHIKFGFFILS